MPVTEALMSPGSFDLDLVADCPDDIKLLCRPGANIIVTDVDLGDDITDPYDLADLAIYNSIILDRTYKTGHLEGCGMLGYLESEKGYAGSQSAGGHGDLVTWPATISDIVAAWFNGTARSNGLRSGTAFSATSTTVGDIFQLAYLPPFKGPLDTVMQQTGNEYRCNPSGVVDWGTAAALFASTPTTAIYPGHAGHDRSVTVLETAECEIRESLRQFRNIAETIDMFPNTVTTGGAGAGVLRWYPAGDYWQLITPQRVEVPSLDLGDTTNIADAIAAKYADIRFEITVSVIEPCISKLITPGDWTGLYDPDANFYDITNPLDFEGGVIWPKAIRVVGYTWPLLRGMGVYVAYDGNTPKVKRISDFIAWENNEDGTIPATELVIGDKPLPRIADAYGSAID